MPQLKILNTREIKKIRDYLKEHYGAQNLLKDYIFMRNNKGRTFIITRDYAKILKARIRINRIGMYFGREQTCGLRLSIEGAQIINPTKNIIEIKDAKKWARGFNIELSGKSRKKYKGYVIVKHKEDILGCGKYKEGVLLNFIPKDRRIAKEPEFKTYKCCRTNFK